MREARTSTARAIELMAQTLQVEYRFIVHYPRLMDMAPDTESRGMMQRIGSDSVKHADVVRQAIQALGGTPPFPALEALPDLPIGEMFRKQLEYERLALMLHSRAAELVGPEWREAVRRIAEEERWHIRGVEGILERLGFSSLTAQGS